MMRKWQIRKTSNTDRQRRAKIFSGTSTENSYATGRHNIFVDAHLGQKALTGEALLQRHRFL